MDAVSPLTEIIERRYSCRNYQKRAIDGIRRKQMNAVLQGLPAGPFGGTPRFHLITAKDNDRKVLKGLGTYGFIRDAAGYIVGAMQSASHDLEDYGYLMESIILQATGIKLGTCWLGGSFTKSGFARKIDTRSDETVPAVAAVGYPAEKMRPFESVIRWGMKASNRKPWSELFFRDRFGRPLRQKDAGTAVVPLEMVRLGPSASNRQPWRIVFSPAKPAFHFYLQRTRGYYQRNKQLFSMADLQRVDLGIAMCHFELTCRNIGFGGGWLTREPVVGELPPLTEYLVSWVTTKK